MQDKASTTDQYTCSNCGGKLVYAPGTQHLQCEQCQSTFPIPESDEEIVELDLQAFLSDALGQADKVVVHTVNCNSCGATTTLDPSVEAASCVYCATPLVVTEIHDEEIIRPKSLLPFKIDKKEARARFKKWLTGYFWIPNKLKKAVVNTKHFQGGYLPFWTYDSATSSRYSGQRGEYYYETQTYTENGQTKTRQVRRTRWWPVSGHVYADFDDVLIGGTKSIPSKYLHRLEPWDLEALVPFDPQYLSGYVAEKYQVSVEDGWEQATQVMAEHIRERVRRDIGGDEQRINSVHTQYSKSTFKHLLLPVYLSAFRYKEKLYQFFVNARTGEVQGKRPISAVKVAIAVILGIIVIGGIIYLVATNQ